MELRGAGRKPTVSRLGLDVALDVPVAAAPQNTGSKAAKSIIGNITAKDPGY